MSIKTTLLAGTALLAMNFARPATAGETLTGTWEGHMVSQKGKIPANVYLKPLAVLVIRHHQ